MNIPTYPVTSAIPLQGKDYLPYVLDQIDSAKNRIWASIFIVDTRIKQDHYRSVRSLIQKLEYAKWRNVDVRVIIGTATITEIYLASRTSAYYMKKRGLEVRQYGSAYRKATHSKYLIFDNDLVITGSNNWSHEAFHKAVESSLAVESKGINQDLSQEFISIWNTSKKINHEN